MRSTTTIKELERVVPGRDITRTFQIVLDGVIVCDARGRTVHATEAEALYDYSKSAMMEPAAGYLRWERPYIYRGTSREAADDQGRSLVQMSIEAQRQMQANGLA